MNLAMSFPDWNSLDSVRAALSDLELAALVFFAILVIFDSLAHFSEKKERLFEKIGLCFFAVAVLAETVAYRYGQRNDFLSGQVITDLQTSVKIAKQSAIDAANAAGRAEKSLDAVEKRADALGDRLDVASSKLNDTEERLSAQGHRSARLLASQKYLEAALKPFPGQTFELTYCSFTKHDPEVSDTGIVLIGTLQRAGWFPGAKSADSKGRIEVWMMRDREVHVCTSGITIRFRSTASESTKKAASALAKSLVKALGKHSVSNLMGGDVTMRETLGPVPFDSEQWPSEPDMILIEVQAHP